MNRIRSLALALALLCAACGSATSSSTCAEYAAEVDQMIASGASTEELDRFIEDTSDHVAELIAKDPEAAGPCAEAMFGALFDGMLGDLETMLDG